MPLFAPPSISIPGSRGMEERVGEKGRESGREGEREGVRVRER